MDFLYLIVFIVGLWGIRYENLRIDSYMKKEQTGAINGFFVLLVFFRHFAQYVTLGKYDLIFQKIDMLLGQLIVTTFLFYSGYGIIYCVKTKESYLSSLPKRFLKVLIHFDMAVIIYLVVGICILKNSYPIKKILLSFIGWESLGNSNWYIFAILCMYAITYICGLFCKNRKYLILFITVGCVLYSFLINFAGKTAIWYCNILCFPFGMLYGEYIERINSFFIKKRWSAYLYPLSSLLIFAICMYSMEGGGSSYVTIMLYEFANISFCLFVISITLLFKIGNPILSWLGKSVFEIYILQRLPMILFTNIIINKFLYFILCICITILFSVLFSWLEKQIDIVLFNRIKGYK